MRECKSFVFRFADVEVREREFCLIKGGETLAVEPKAFRVLLFLLRSPQKLVTKEQLMNAVWGDAAVTENSLTRCIFLLRRILKDDATEPHFIATVATVGYRFVSPVEVNEDNSGDLAGPAGANGLGSLDLSGIHANGSAARASAGPSGEIYSPPVTATVPMHSPLGHRRDLHRRWLFAAAFLAVTIATLIWYLRRPLPMFHVSKYTQITHDGRRKIPLGTDGVRLYLNEYPDPDPPSQVALSGGEATRIPMAVPNPWLVDVSSNGSTLLVLSNPANPTSLWSVPVLGTSVRHLLDGDVVTGAWSPDGKSLVFATSNGDIGVMQSDGSGAHRVANVPYRSLNFFFERIAWSPDGSTIRFDRNNEIYEVKPDGSGLHPFLSGWRDSSARCCGQWTPDGRFFLFLVFDPFSSTEAVMQPATQIWALDEHPGPFQTTAEPVQLTSGPTRWGRPIPGKDGKSIFAMGAAQNGELVQVDGNSHQLQPYLGGMSAEGVSFSPDGRFIAYVTFPEGILWRANRDGSGPAQLTDPPLYPALPHWSPDGTQILFSAADKAGKMKSYILPSQGGALQPILPEDKDEQDDPSWSPDGRKIVFDSVQIAGETSDTSKRFTRILDLTSHQSIILSQSVGMTRVRWSPDGRILAGIDRASGDLKAFNFGKQQWSMLHKGDTEYPTGRGTANLSTSWVPAMIRACFESVLRAAKRSASSI